MDPVNNQGSMDKVADVLASVRKKGVKLWAEDGQLHYKAPKGALLQEEVERLRLLRNQVVALLERINVEDSAEPKLEPRSPLNRAPLAFSQLAHWHLYGLSERRAMRQVASATRVRGRLSLDALRKSIADVVHRHEALRTRIIVLDGVPIQDISESGDCEIIVDDVTTLSESFREVEVKRLIEQLILEPIDVAAGPLFGVRLVKLRDDEYVLIMAMEHMIADGLSLNVLARDLLVAYMQALKRCAFPLPKIPVQFADYAVWQRNTQRSWLAKHGAYWNKRLIGYQRLRFPEDQSLQVATLLGRGTIPLQIGKDLKAQLREWSRLRQTTLVMTVFTAYVALVLRWCNASESVIPYQFDGRVNPTVENTIGYFASVLYLRIELREDDSFIDLVHRVTVEYCQAYEHADFSYMAAQVPRPEFTRNTVFNWVPQGSNLDLSALDGSADAITCSQIRFTRPMLKTLELDVEPMILLFDTDDEVVGGIYFSLNRFSLSRMERFGRNFLMFIEALLRQPERRVRDILLV